MKTQETINSEPAKDARQQRQAQLAQLRQQRESTAGRDASLARLRGFTFLALLGAGAWGLLTREALAAWLSLAAGSGFAMLVVLHARVSTRLFEIDRRKLLCERSLARMDEQYRAAPKETERLGEVFTDPEHPYSGDLDLFGHGSLFEQLDTTETSGGRARLASWLKGAADPEELGQRQAAVQALSADLLFRDELILAARRCRTAASDANSLLAWAAEKPTLSPRHRPLLLLAGCVVALTTVLMVMASMHGQWWTRLWLLLIAVQGTLMFVLRGRLGSVIAPPSQRSSPVERYRAIVAKIEEGLKDEPTSSAGRFETLRGRLRGGGPTYRASTQLARLDRAAGFASVRHSALGHFLMNLGFMWDLWCAYGLDRWRAEHGAVLAAWLDALHECEALSALATFAAEHPQYAWPTINAKAGHFVAQDLGHPLICTSDRVANDVALDGETAALMITGSNMSGKSTMLRSIGIAAVLGQAGAPVCARSLEMSPMVLWTSMRVDDSLAEGASRFYAEIAKLKRILDIVQAPEAPVVLFLLDEVLHGTNSRERNIGAKAIVRRLVERGAVGAVSSHDLGLTSLEELTAGRIANTHFEDHLEDGVMCFDYRMKRGPVATSNALRLMRAVGIDLEALTENHGRS